jgi:flagella basal body P-ring formation protein FlgA
MNNRYISQSPRPAALMALCLAVFWLSSVDGQWLEYVPDGSAMGFMATDGQRAFLLELKEEADVSGSSVRLKHVVRCGPDVAEALDGTMEVELARMEPNKPPITLDMAQMKRALEDHGVNLLSLRFGGAAQCKVQRVDNPTDVAAMRQARTQLKAALADAREGAAPASSTVAPLGATGVSDQAFPSLRDVLIQDVADRFGLAVDSLVVRFKPENEKLLSLTEAQARLTVQPRRQPNIGNVTWDVLIGADGQTGNRVPISAEVRAWRTQLRTTRALAYHQVIKEQDVRQTRVLVDRLADGQQLELAQVVGSEAARAMGPDELLTGSNVQASQLVKTGQLVTVTVEKPGVQLKWVAEARESGVYGQVIRVRRPGTREEFFVRLSGPEQGLLVDGNEYRVAGR